MTDQEIQELIDNKDWKKIPETFIFDTLNPSGLSRFNLTLDFWKEYFLNEDHTSNITNNVYDYGFLSNCKSYIIDHGMSSVEFWDYWIDSTLKNARQSSRMIYEMLFPIDHIHILKAFLKDGNIEKINTALKQTYTDINKVVFLDLNLYFSLNSEEQETFKKGLNFNNSPTLRLNNCSLAIDIFDGDIKKTLEFNEKTQDGFYESKILKNADEEKIKELIKTEEDIYSYVRFYKYNNVEIPDDIVEEIIKKSTMNINFQENFVKNLSLRQLEKYFNDIDLRLLAQNPNTPLDEISNLAKKNDKYVDVSYSRFFTEEEMLSNPELFYPKNVAHYCKYYVSKDTFKLLNKTWGRRFHYNKDLTNLNEILNNLETDITFEIFEYLLKKCKPTNEYIIEILKTYLDLEHDFVKRAHTLGKFCDKYD